MFWLMTSQCSCKGDLSQSHNAVYDETAVSQSHIAMLNGTPFVGSGRRAVKFYWQELYEISPRSRSSIKDSVTILFIKWCQTSYPALFHVGLIVAVLLSKFHLMLPQWPNELFVFIAAGNGVSPIRHRAIHWIMIQFIDAYIRHLASMN